MRKLDKSRPYGTIAGCNLGRMFEQDGVFFNGDGTEWVDPKPKHGSAPQGDKTETVTKTAAKPAAKPVAKAAAKKASAATKAVKVSAIKPADDQVSSQLQQ